MPQSRFEKKIVMVTSAVGIGGRTWISYTGVMEIYSGGGFGFDYGAKDSLYLVTGVIIPPTLEGRI